MLESSPRPRRSALTLLGFALLLPLVAAPVLAQTDLAFADPRALEAPPCVADPHTLCLNGGRFAVTASYRMSPSGPSVWAMAVPLTGETGYFWFFDGANVELIVKVLDGCGVSNSYWFFAAGLTNLGVDIEVRDLRTGETRLYTNPVGTPFAPIQDTAAFNACP